MLTAAELETRRTAIGASDAAAVLGVDPYRTAYEVFCEKTGRLPPFEGNKFTAAGNRFESAVLDWAEEQLGPLSRNIRLPHEGYPIAATCDAISKECFPVEAKTAGLFSPLSDAWGREDSDEIPERYIVQLQVQMMCTQAEEARLAAFLGGRGFVMYQVRRSDRLVEYIRRKLSDWWQAHVVADVPPVYDPVVAVEVHKRIVRTPEKVVDVEPRLVQEFLAADATLKSAEKTQEAAKARLIDALGDGEIGNFNDAAKQVTYFERRRAAYQVKESRFRVLCVSKKKE